MELTREVAKRVLDVVDAGLVKGMGNPKAGEMCVEAAVCFALGLPHSDKPPCVGYAVRALKIALNDKDWSSDAARAKGMRRIAIAQLGSVDIDQVAFAKLVAEGVIREILPIALRAAASVQKDKKHKKALEVAADKCEKDGTREAALQGKTAAYAAYADAAAASAAYAADADAASADAADAAADAKGVKKLFSKDSIFTMLAEIAVRALVKLGSQGSKWLDLCE